MINNTTTVKDAGDHKLVSDWMALILQVILINVLCTIVSIFGIITNIFNIIVFVKQGVYKESGVVNLLGLAIADFLCVFTMLYNSYCHAIVFINPPNLSWDPYSVLYITGAWPHLMFAQITRAVTAYVALERCICVVFPFKVKSIFTPNRSIAIIVCIFLTFFISYSPVFIKQQLKYRTDPLTNVTKLVLVSSSDWLYIVDIMWYINSIVFNQGSVAIVLVSTVVTVSRLRLSKTWRESTTSVKSLTASSSSSLSAVSSKRETNDNGKTLGDGPPKLMTSKIQKERRLIAMISLISVIFLLCYIPDLSFLLLYSIVPDVRILGKYHNLALVMYAFTFFMETFNSSINIFVYYSMSSKYKEIFQQVVGLSITK